MTQNTTSETGFGRPRVRRGLGFLVGVTVALTPMAIAPAAAPAATSAKHVLRADYNSPNLILRLLGGGGGRGYGPVDGLGSLVSRILDAIADLVDGDGGPPHRR
jgi:hypothetical protein